MYQVQESTLAGLLEEAIGRLEPPWESPELHPESDAKLGVAQMLPFSGASEQSTCLILIFSGRVLVGPKSMTVVQCSCTVGPVPQGRAWQKGC